MKHVMFLVKIFVTYYLLLLDNIGCSDVLAHTSSRLADLNVLFRNWMVDTGNNLMYFYNSYPRKMVENLWPQRRKKWI
jgi:hypothetical protein